MPPTPEKLRVSGAWLRSRDMVSFRATGRYGRVASSRSAGLEAGVEWGVGGGGGEGAGGCGHALAAFKYFLNT